ncbi:MAG: transposase [Pseudobacteriovorax sp.]|nr:transposase [Pseudobacteriovorax sp.]
MQQISEKISEKLHIQPRKLTVHRFIKPVYGCKKCEAVKQASMPAHPLARCSVTLESLAYLACSIYVEGLPLYRIEKSLKNDNIELGRDKMSRWMIQISEKLLPVKKLLHEILLKSPAISMDETSFQVLKEKDRRADQKSYVLVQAREGPPGKKITVFHYEKSRAKATIEKYLEGFSGSFLTDGLGVYQTYTEVASFPRTPV